MQLPAKGEDVPLSRIREICDHFGLQGLWQKIEQDPPQKPFKSDGCSLWCDSCNGVDLYPACFLHDLKYWAGRPGEETERLIADAELLIDVARRLGSPRVAECMYQAVRVGGHEVFAQPFSWGFGRTPREPLCTRLLRTLAS